MSSDRIPAIKPQALIGLCIFVFGLWAAWQAGNRVAAQDMRSLELVALLIVACIAAAATLRKWRTGFYLFFVLLMFEDLARKFLGNNLALFFGKDILLAVVYVALYLQSRHGREKTFHPPFLLFFSLFFWLGILQLFNPNSPSILYGLLGFKVYFYYVPLLFVGYSLIRNDQDLRKFLFLNAILAAVIGCLGIIQAIIGNSFLNPATLSPELEDLGDLYKVSPLSGQAFSLPDSVFVSSGRFAIYLVVAFIVVLGTAGYLLLYTRRNRRLTFLVIGILSVAALLSGSRTAVVGVISSAIALSIGFIWGTKRRLGGSQPLARAIRRSVIFAGIGLAAVTLLFPSQSSSRLSYYTETLNPGSSAYAGTARSWDYPIENLLIAFDRPHWIMGNGIGTASLGIQYVAKLTGKPMPNLWIESGFGVLIVEMGIIAPFLWILWTATLLYYSWKVVRQVKGSRFFPLAFAIFWYAVFLLYPLTYVGLSPYQNYTCNAYLWLLVGILFRLPDILAMQATPVPIPARGPTARL